MSKRQGGLTQAELERLADDLFDEEGDDQCDFDSDDSMKDPDFSIKKRAPGSQLQDSTNYESSENDDDEETQDIQEILHELTLDEALPEENDENREQYEIPNSDIIWSEYVGHHKNFDFTGLRGL
ncbi:hypothetical protein HHI36_005684 [Cryptolaemus montrouzieri]|uniref:Uncharacterized protein n=1 Tax=Cryptolaemus montrouzieri TaxID=559131 RepID=A0ABD2NUV4_9CUCU